MFEIRQCPACRLRYPVVLDNLLGTDCPACGSPTRAATSKFGAHTVGDRPPTPAGLVQAALLDNIRSAWNVGSMFRSAEAAGLSHLYLCGITATPENPKVAKTALGAEKTVTWSHDKDGLAAALALQREGFHLWALEAGPRSKSIFEAPREQDETAVVFVVGNEISGVDPALLEICERVLRIPMHGSKESLNAAVAFGVGVYVLQYLGVQQGQIDPGN